MKYKILVLSVLMAVSLAGCRKEPTVESEPEQVTEQTTADEDLNIRIDSQKPLMQGVSVDEDGNITIDETFSLETKSIQEQMETLEEGDPYEKARANDESLKAREEESRAAAGESLSAEELRDAEVISEDEMARLHQEFQSEIDEFNEKQYESMMAEWESSRASK